MFNEFFKSTLFLNRIVILTSFVIVTLILWNTYSFFNKFKSEERLKVNVIASALEEIGNNPNLNDTFKIESEVIENNKNIPLLLVDENDEILRTPDGSVDQK